MSVVSLLLYSYFNCTYHSGRLDLPVTVFMIVAAASVTLMIVVIMIAAAATITCCHKDC